MKKIYVFDEEKELTSVLEDVMKKENSIKVKRFSTDKIFEALIDIPDIIIINEDNINIDISEAFQKIKANDEIAIAPTIVISSNNEEEHVIQLLKNDVELYLQTPVNPQILYYSIINFIKILNRTRTVSPLTGLPGNVQIQVEMQKRLLEEEKYAMMYIDLDNFKAYNDTYGFSNGDEVIKLTAKIIVKHVLKQSEKNNFVGHVGGDDFIAIVEGDDYESISQSIIAEFDESIEKYFTKEDLARGFLEVENRKGVMEQFPLTSISIGVVEVTKERFKNTLEIGEAGAEVKHMAKTIFGSSYVIDRRKNRSISFNKAKAGFKIDK